MPHSELFDALVSPQLMNDKTEHHLNGTSLQKGIKDADVEHSQELYVELSDLLRETNDAQSGIVSALVGEEWVRDATQSLPLNQRISPDAPVIEANNALLRCLSRLRPIDYAIDKKHRNNNPQLSEQIRGDLKESLAKLTTDVLTVAQSDKTDKEKLEAIKKLEKDFDTVLIEKLHKANLTSGCESAEDAEKLLFHYRNLSSVLEPARTMVTLTYDETAGVLQRETQYPVTEKTQKQKADLERLTSLQPHPFKLERTAHNVRDLATQEADCLFAELLVDDERSLSAQARKTHLVGAKNAFIVKNELFSLRKGEELPGEFALQRMEASPENTLWLARTGVPVYVGKGESEARVQEHTRENLEQIRSAAKMRMSINDLALHITCLNTYSPLENQAMMIDHLYQATRNQPESRDDITYAPTNPDGTFRALDVASGLGFAEGESPGRGLPLQKADRLMQVAQVVLKAADNPEIISIVQCASGQDRTGTAVEKSTQIWMQKRYDDLGLATTNIETMRAQGGNAAEITSHHIHGSPGMKKESMANNFFGSVTGFGKDASEQFYRSSANSNKKNPVGKVDFLKQPSEEAVQQYKKQLDTFEQNLQAFQKTMAGDQNKQKMHASGLDLMHKVKEIASKNPGAKDLADLTTILTHSNTLLQNHDKKDSPEFKESSRRLASMANNVSGKFSSAWTAVGASLALFTCLALVVAGILAAIPSGGTSLLLTAAGATGLSLVAAGGIGAGVVAGTGIAGIAASIIGKEQGLAKSVTNFKSTLNDIKHPEKMEEEKSLLPTFRS